MTEPSLPSTSSAAYAGGTPAPPGAAVLQANAAAEDLPNAPPGSVTTPCMMTGAWTTSSTPPAGARPAYTREETRILMSFAMRTGGHLFSQWLRNRLMSSLDYYTPNSIYVDTVASREREMEFPASKPAEKEMKAGVTYVVPEDDEEKAKEAGFTTIGALNNEWNKAYRNAMSEADVMIIVLTPDYMNSKWCMKEWGQYKRERLKRKILGRPPLHGLVIGFGTDQEAKDFAGGKADTITVPKILTSEGHQTARGPGGIGWATSEAGHQQIVDWVKAHGG